MNRSTSGWRFDPSWRAAYRHPVTAEDVELRELIPRVLSVLVCRGADFATAEDAVQEALIRALSA